MSNNWGPSLRRGPYSGDNEKGCWLWTGGTVGRLHYGKTNHDGRTIRVHRAVYEAVTGRSPIEVRHTCDEPLCYRPCHLIDGTSQDNADDMVARRRQSRGEDRHNALLTADAVRAIREAHARLLDELADRYRISRQAVAAIVARRNWKDVA